MNAPALTVRHTSTHKGEPLAVVDGLSGGHAAMTPTQMRTLAAVLRTVADECEGLPIHNDPTRNVRHYPMQPWASRKTEPAASTTRGKPTAGRSEGVAA